MLTLVSRNTLTKSPFSSCASSSPSGGDLSHPPEEGDNRAAEQEGSDAHEDRHETVELKKVEFMDRIVWLFHSPYEVVPVWVGLHVAVSTATALNTWTKTAFWPRAAGAEQRARRAAEKKLYLGDICEYCSLREGTKTLSGT